MPNCEFCNGAISPASNHIHVEQFTDANVSAADAADFYVCSWACLAGEAKKRGETKLRKRIADQERAIERLRNGNRALTCQHECPKCGKIFVTHESIVGLFLIGAVEFAVLAIVLLLMILCAPKAHGQTHPSDSVYVPSAISLTNGPGTYRTRLDVTNLTGDPVLVTFTFQPVNTFDGRNAITVPWGLWIGSHATMPLDDALAFCGITQAQGQLILDACLAGADCSRKAEDARELAGQPSMRRVIGVSSVNCAAVQGIGSHCWARSGVPFNEYVSSDDRTAGLDHVAIIGIKDDDRYLTKVGVNNMSAFNSTVAVMTLFDGAGIRRGQAIQPLGPLVAFYRSVEEIFPVLLQQNRLDRTPLVANPWIRVEQTDTAWGAEADAAGCINGCARFTAYADMRDRLSGSVTPLGVEYDAPDPGKGFCAQNPGACGGLAPKALAVRALSVVPQSAFTDDNEMVRSLLTVMSTQDRLLAIARNDAQRRAAILADPVVIRAMVREQGASAAVKVAVPVPHQRIEKE